MTSFFHKGMRRDIGRRADTHDANGKVNGWRTVPDGYELGDIELVIDMDALMRVMGDKALRNTTGKATIASGLIKARVSNRRRFKP